MARNSQTNGRRGSSSPRANPALVPGLLALALIAVAIVVAMLAKKPEQEAVATPKRGPFDDMPPEAPPPPREKKPGADRPPAPDSITSEPLWVAAQATAKEGLSLYAEAVAAKNANDLALAATKGKAAREKLDAAIVSTADWETMLEETYNSYDTKVQAIHDARTDWFNKLNWLKKSVGH